MEVAQIRLTSSAAELSKDYDLAYKNIDQDDLSQLLDYKSEYLANVKALLSDSSLGEALDEEAGQEEKDADSSLITVEKESIGLLKQITDPQNMKSIIGMYHQYFSNVKFTYLEQSSKEKFLRNVVNSKFISLKELETLKFNAANNKKKLQLKKQRRNHLLKEVNNRLQDNHICYENIKNLKNNVKASIAKSKILLEQIDKLEKENSESFETKSTHFDNDEEVLDSLHAINDFMDLVQESQDDSIITAEQQRKAFDAGVEVSQDSSIVSEFDDYILLNSSKNLSALVKKRRACIQDAEIGKEKVSKKIKHAESNLIEQEVIAENLAKAKWHLESNIADKERKNREVLQKHKQAGEEKLFKNKENMSEWMSELLVLLKKLDGLQTSYSGNGEKSNGNTGVYNLVLSYGKLSMKVKLVEITLGEECKYKVKEVGTCDSDKKDLSALLEKENGNSQSNSVTPKNSNSFSSLLDVIECVLGFTKG